MLRSLGVFSLLSVSMSGCSTVPDVARIESAPQIGASIFGDMKDAKAGAIYVWNPYNSAAIVDEKGNRCVLAAGGAKTFSTKSDSGISIDGLKALIESSSLSATQKSELVQEFTKLSSGDADSAFLDIALFHLCILDQNGTFGTDDNGLVKPKAEPILKAYLEVIRLSRQKAKD